MRTDLVVEDSKWARASLRVVSSTLAPKAIEQAFGVDSDSSYAAGDAVSKRGGLRTFNGFFLESGLPTNRPLNEHLEALLSRISPFEVALRENPELHADIFCGFSSTNGQGGFTLATELLDRLADLGLPVTFDLYPPAERDA